MARPKNDGKGRLGGRQKGTPNKITTDLKEWISKLINDNREQIERDLEQLEPKERLQMLEKLMQYVVPRQQAVSAEVDFNNLSEEQLDTIISELTKDLEDE